MLDMACTAKMKKGGPPGFQLAGARKRRTFATAAGQGSDAAACGLADDLSYKSADGIDPKAENRGLSTFCPIQNDIKPEQLRPSARGRGHRHLGWGTRNRHPPVRPLRIWERRYGFPSPGVTVRVSGLTLPARRRGCAPHQAAAGRWHRPGRVVLASEAQLQGWLTAPPPALRRATATSPGWRTFRRASRHRSRRPARHSSRRLVRRRCRPAGPGHRRMPGCLKRPDVDGLRQAPDPSAASLLPALG